MRFSPLFSPHHVAAAHSRDRLSVRTKDAQRERSGGRWVSLWLAGVHGVSLFFLPFEVIADGCEKVRSASQRRYFMESMNDALIARPNLRAAA